jgi:hypothetical protein
MATALPGIDPNAASLTSTLSDTNTQLPAWLQEYTRGLAGQAAEVAGGAYTPYQAPTGAATYGEDTGQIAGLNAIQNQAIADTQANQGNWQQYTNAASQTVPQAVGQYMSPYTDSVVNRIAQLGQRNLTENLLPQVNSTFTGAGQFGSTRNAGFMNNALRDANESILDQQSQALQTGFQNAQNMALADLQRQAILGGQVQQYAANDAGALSTAGGQQQALTQQNLTAANNDWQNQNNWQRGNLDWLSQIIRGLPAQQSTTQSVTQVPTAGTQVSPLAAAAQGFAGARALASPITAAQAPVPR